MADVYPFQALRYDLAQVGDLSDVTCPPYDVIDAAFQERLYKLHPCNIIRLELNREEPGDPTPDEKYVRATRLLARWLQEGVLQREREEALYVYHQEFQWEGKTHIRKGFMGRIRLERFGQGKVFPHEQTLSGPKADRLKLLEATRTNLSPIFGLYPDTDNAAMAPLEQAVITLTPIVATDHLGVVHRFWPVMDQAIIEKVRGLMREKPIFIADGHHRYETAINYRDGLEAKGKLAGPDAPENFVMMMFVGMSDPGLVIMPTHRLVSGIGEITAEELKAAIGSHFAVETVGTGAAGAKSAWELVEADGGQDVFGFGTTKDGVWSFARVTDASPMKTLAPDQTDAWRGLGVSLLHKLVIDHLLKKARPTAEAKFRYVHLVDEVTDAQKTGECQLGCLVPAARISHVEQIAEKLEKMPPKSTYFYPKLQTGLMFNPLG
jgi:uncharacterized protein (DUF1015 family)